jgi:hypothetical protein
MRKILFSLALLFMTRAQAQLNESFNDGDFTANPIWSGTSNWLIANSDVAAGAIASNTLRLNETTAGANYLSTQVSGPWGVSQVWRFWLGRRGQAATAANRNYVWLYASEPNLIGSTVDGYRIHFGDDGTGTDKIVLEKVTDGVATALSSSAGATTNSIEDFGFLVRITREGSGLWNIYTSVLPTASGTGAIATDAPTDANTMVAQASVTDNSYTTFTDGFVGFAATNTSTTAARTAAEFDQFQLDFKEAGALPIQFNSVKAAQVPAGILIQWDNLTETDAAAYVVERADDGRNFSALARLDACKNNGEKAHYQFIDRSPLAAISFYRIKGIETNGKLVISSIIKINRDRGNTGLALYPNPVRENQLVWQAGGLPAANYKLTIYNSCGQAVIQKPLGFTGGSPTESIALNKLTPGIYILEIKGHIKLQQQFVIQ